MKETLLNLIEKTIFLEYRLPHAEHNIDKSCITHPNKTDDCYAIEKLDDLSRIIYESILYYSYDEYQLNDGNPQKMFLNAFKRKFKYNGDASELSKRKLGIYGESLLYALLKVFYGTSTLISRGYFYDIQKKSEVTGYDCFHLIENNNSLELWFGESKFYEHVTGAIDSVFGKIRNAISDEYLTNTNFATIIQHSGNITDKDTQIYKILKKWEKGLIENLVAELNQNSIKLIYPILIVYDQDKNHEESVKKAIEYINKHYSHVKFDDISIDYSIFFIFLPINGVKSCKEKVITWIDKQEPLMP